MDSKKADSSTQEERDRVFAETKEEIADFTFGKETAAVFDDMLDRSVPFYSEMQRMTAELVADFAQPHTKIYDLGCSTCNTFLQVGPLLPKEMDLRFVGLDSSQEMLDKARAKLMRSDFNHAYELNFADLNEHVQIDNASVVILTLTLQFLRPMYRERLMNRIQRGMTDGGALILVEKVLGEDSMFNRLFIKHYYEMKKRNGYSELEIAQKREALENVLIPYRHGENVELLRNAGFRHIDVFFKWYNFCCTIAIK